MRAAAPWLNKFEPNPVDDCRVFLCLTSNSACCRKGTTQPSRRVIEERETKKKKRRGQGSLNYKISLQHGPRTEERGALKPSTPPALETKSSQITDRTLHLTRFPPYQQVLRITFFSPLLSPHITCGRPRVSKLSFSLCSPPTPYHPCGLSILTSDKPCSSDISLAYYIRKKIIQRK